MCAGSLAESGKVGTIIAAHPLAGLGSPITDDATFAVAADEEALPFADGSLDLVVSALALQFVNDLPGTLIQVRRALKPDGLLLAALLGGDTLTELRQAFAAAEPKSRAVCRRGSRRSSTCAISVSLLQRAGFALPVTDVDRLTVRYASVEALMHDLRRMGATNPLVARRRDPLKRATLARMTDIYRERFADPDGRIRATFEIVWLVRMGAACQPAAAAAAGHGAGRGWPMRSASTRYRPARKRAAERLRLRTAPRPWR